MPAQRTASSSLAPAPPPAASTLPGQAASARESRDIGRGTAKALLALAVVIAAVLRFAGGGDQLWFDEIRTLIDSVRRPIAVIVTHFPSDNDHVLYSVLAHVSIDLGGESPLMLRFPAILFGIASIPLLYSFGTRITTRFEALAGAILATFAAHHIWFSQNARGYTLLLVLTLIGTQLILSGLKRRSIKPWLLFAIAGALSAYTHLSMILAVVGQAIAVGIHLVAARRFAVDDWKGPAVGFIGAAALTIILYLPMLGDVTGFFRDQGTGIRPTPVGSGVLDLFRNPELDFLGMGVLILGGVIMLVGAVSYWRQAPLIPALFFIPPAMVHLAAVLLERPSRPRFFFFIAGFLLLVGVRGVFVIVQFVVDRFGQPWTGWEKSVQWAAVAAMTGFIAFDLSRAYGRPKMDYEGALAYVEASRRPGDIVALGGIGTGYVYTSYYDRQWPRLMSNEHLASLRRRNDVLVLHTFEVPLAHADPALLQALKTRCTELRNFTGTLRDGDIFVSRCARQP